MSRVQLYKIRRLVKKGGEEYYEFLKAWGERHTHWIRVRPEDAVNDGYAFSTFREATTICDHMKVRNMDPHVVYHTVVPA